MSCTVLKHKDIHYLRHFSYFLISSRNKIIDLNILSCALCGCVRWRLLKAVQQFEVMKLTKVFKILVFKIMMLFVHLVQIKSTIN